MRHAQNSTSYLTGALCDLGRWHGALHLDKPAGMSVDHRHRRSKFVRGHGDEIALRLSQPLFLGQLLFEQRSLLGEHALTAHQLNCVVAKYYSSLFHLADLVDASGFRNFDIGVVGRETAHAVSKIKQRRRYIPADVDKRGDDHDACEQHAKHDQPNRMTVCDTETVACYLCACDSLIGKMPQCVAG